MQQYRIQKIIGQGAFGNAYQARHLGQNKDYVIKKVELTNKTAQQTENIYNEVKLLEEFKHFNIVSYRQSIKDGQDLNIVMEFCAGGDLNQLIGELKQSGSKRLEEKKVIDWATQIALAIHYMHDKRILHRDLKTPNIFLADDRVKLGDFGISKVLDQKIDLASTSIGTPYYMSPEQYRHKPYSYRSDIWAFGCILYQMCNQKRPFQALSLNGLAVKVLEANFAPVSQFYSKQLRQLIKRMLQKKQKDRPSILQFLQTPIIRKRVISYMKQVYDILSQQNGDKVLLEGLFYQAKKLGISLSDTPSGQETQKKYKPQFSSQKKRQQKERIRQQLQQQLKKLSQKNKKQKDQLKRLEDDRKNILKSHRKQSQKSLVSNKKYSISSSSSAKSIKDVSAVTSASSNLEAKKSSTFFAKKEEKPKIFKMEEQYDMYDMEFEEEDSEDQTPVQIIHEVDQEEEKHQIIKPERNYEKDKYKSNPINKEKEGKQIKQVKQVREGKEGKEVREIKEVKEIKEVREVKEVKEVKEVQEVKEGKEIKQIPKQIKQVKQNSAIKKVQQIIVNSSRFNQQQIAAIAKSQTQQVPIEQAITNLRSSLKVNNQKLNTIKNELSNIDFSISSSDDQFQKTIQRAEDNPFIKKKQKNPVHIVLTDRINDLRQNLQMIINKDTLQKLLNLAKIKKANPTRTEIEKISGTSKIGAFHLVNQIVKLDTLLQRIPLFIS